MTLIMFLLFPNFETPWVFLVGVSDVAIDLYYDPECNADGPG